jgi:regulator of protease activity HflC (stomatin/prohibitin superfamily)
MNLLRDAATMPAHRVGRPPRPGLRSSADPRRWCGQGRGSKLDDGNRAASHGWAWAESAHLKGTCMPLFFFTVEQQERAVVERFGKFVRVAGPGLQRKSPFVERVAGSMSLQVEQLNTDIETKTKDNVFVVVKLAVQYMVGADEEKVKDAFYKLDNPEAQMTSFALDVVRSHIPTMNLDEAYADADTIAKHIQETLQRQMATYGYEIIKALVTNIEPDQKVKDAMNNINAASRDREAANQRGEAEKVLAIKRAEADKESMRLHGEGVAEQRKAIAQGLKDSLAVIANQDGLNAKEAMGLVALTQYMDTLRSVGENGNMTTLLLPHSPASVGSLMDQVQEGMLTGNLAADAAAGGDNGGERGRSARQTRLTPPGASQS